MKQDNETAERLIEWLGSQVPEWDEVRVDGLERIDFGRSAEMLAFTIVHRSSGGEGRQDVVVRLRPAPPALLEPYDLERQFDILRALEGTAVRVPRALWFEESGDVLGRPFFVMERAGGSVYEMDTPEGDAGSPKNIRRMCEGMAEELAQIHLVDLDAAGLAFLGDGRAHLTDELNHWADEMHRVQHGTLPALERLLKELRDTVPQPCPHITLVHGDAKPGNIAFEGTEVSAVFDWEMTGIGDPLTDIGWMEMLWMQPVGITSDPGACSIDEFIAHYEEVSGIRVENRPWYRAFNAFKMAVICLIGAMLVDDGYSDDEKLVLGALGTEILTLVGLADLGVTEQFDSGPIAIREERLLALQGHQTSAL